MTRAALPILLSVLAGAIALMGVAWSARSLEAQAAHAARSTMRSLSDSTFADAFADEANLFIELENGGRVVAQNGVLRIDVPAGCTVWYRPMLEGPLAIEYEATLISRGGANDRVSDLNCFWMAGDSRSPDNLFARPRSGSFADYNELTCYYVGHGGNSNTTTRFRRYIGQKDSRPLLPEHDLRDAAVLLEANRPYRIRLVADGRLIQYWCDGRKIFEMHDDAPYTRGHFGWRTVSSHIEIRNFRIGRPRGG